VSKSIAACFMAYTVPYLVCSVSSLKMLSNAEMHHRECWAPSVIIHIHRNHLERKYQWCWASCEVTVRS